MLLQLKLQCLSFQDLLSFPPVPFLADCMLWEQPEYCASWNIFLILGRPPNFDIFFLSAPYWNLYDFPFPSIIISENNISPDIFEVQEILWTMYWRHPLLQKNIYIWIQVWSSLFYFFVSFVLLYWISLGEIVRHKLSISAWCETHLVIKTFLYLLKLYSF